MACQRRFQERKYLGEGNNGSSSLLPSINRLSQTNSDRSRNPNSNICTKRLFSDHSVKSLFTLAQEEVDVSKEKYWSLTEKDETIRQLTLKLAQRDAIITQLEDLVSLQQKVLMINRLYFKQKKKEISSQPEEINIQELLNGFQERLEARKKKNEYLTRRHAERMKRLESFL
jgi:hypothetical protein